MNPLYQELGRQTSGFADMMKSFQQFRQTFRGDPKQTVQKLLESGQMSAQQYEQLQGMARQMMELMK